MKKTKLTKGLKRVLSVALCLVMVATSFFIFDPSVLKELFPVAKALTYSYATSTNPSYSSSDISASSGNATIYTANGINYFRNHTSSYRGATITLQADKVFCMQPSQLTSLSNFTKDEPSFTGYFNYKDIGSTDSWYGTFNGNGSTINGFITHKYTDSWRQSYKDSGFIRIVGGGSTEIKNLNFTYSCAYLRCTTSKDSESPVVRYNAILVGETQDNASNKLTIDNVDMDNVTVLSRCGRGADYSGECGSIVGMMKSPVEIKNCNVTNANVGNFSSNWGKCQGGLVGCAYSNRALTVSDSSFSGNVAPSGSGDNNFGGVIGYSNGSVNISNTTVSGNINGGYYAGGFVGQCENTVTISNCTNSSSVQGRTHLGGFVGYVTSTANVSGSVNSGSVASGSDSNRGRIGGIIGQSNGAVTITSCDNSGQIGHASYRGQFTGGFVGCCDNAITIKGTASDYCTNTGYAVYGTSETGGFVGLSKYNTTFEYCECNVTNLVNSNGQENVGGIIGYACNEGGSYRLSATNCINRSSVSGNGNIGGICGYCIGGSNSSSPILLSGCKNYGTISSTGDACGGIVGKYNSDAYIKFSNCHNYQSISTSYNYTSGICGYCKGSITAENCSNEAAISCKGYSGGICGEIEDDASSFTSCSNTGNVTSTGDCVGGILGKMRTGTLTFTSCNNYGQIKGNVVGGLLGYYYKEGAITVSFDSCFNLGNILPSSNGSGNGGGIIGEVQSNKSGNVITVSMTKCFSGNGVTGNVGASGNAFSNAGGIIGYAHYSSGTVSPQLTAVYSHATITGSGKTAGLIGNYNDNSLSIKNCYFAGTISGGTKNAIVNSSYSGYTPSISSTYYESSCGASCSITGASSKTTTQLQSVYMPVTLSTTYYKYDIQNVNGYYPILATPNNNVQMSEVSYDNIFSLSSWASNVVGEGPEPNKTDTISAYANMTLNQGNASITFDAPAVSVGGWLHVKNDSFFVTVKPNTSYTFSFTLSDKSGDGSSIEILPCTSTGTARSATFAAAPTYSPSSGFSNGYADNWIHIVYCANGTAKCTFTTGSSCTRLQFTFGIANNSSSSTVTQGTYSNIRLVENTMPYNETTYSSGAKIYAYNGGTLGTLCSNPTRTGYTFNGWNTKADGSGSTVTSSTAQFSSPTTVYSQWTPNIYKVTLDNRSATSAGTTAFWYKYRTVTNGVYYYTDANCTTALANYTITKPTKTGYVFDGYFTGTNGSGTQYVRNDGVCINNVYQTAGDKTLYAKWNPITYTVAYNGNGSTGGSTASSTHTYDVADPLTSNGFTRAYTVTYNANNGTNPTLTTANTTATYNFAGWKIRGGDDFNSSTALYGNSSAQTTAVTSSVTLSNGAYVKNLAIKQGGTVNLDAQWNSGSVTLPTPTRTGYTFGGWYKEDSLTNSAGNAGASYTPTANITLYAKWNINPSKLTVNPNGGSVTVGTTAYTSSHTFEQN